MYDACRSSFIPTMSTKRLRIFILFFFLCLPVPLAFSLSFNLSVIGPEDQNKLIEVAGDAYVSGQGIQITPAESQVEMNQTVGRATYIKPLHLWDKVSGTLADFSTNFSFVIDSLGSNNYGDGLAFFLAPIGSSILPNFTGGGLGLASDNSTVNTSSESFVAVEFDTYPNTWDPQYRNSSDPPYYFAHVGIDINSLDSVSTAPWQNNISSGEQNDAWIRYNASSKTLSVDFTASWGNKTRKSRLSHVVDLRHYLPEHVTFGFSAATGSSFQKNNVKSWNFSSTSDLDEMSPAEPPSSPEPGPGGVIIDGKGNNRLGLIVGLSVGLSILIFVSSFVSYCLWNKYKKENGDEESFDPSMEQDFQRGSGPREFPYSKLFHATKKFAEEEKLGEGGFGAVYRGWLRDTNSQIAVKRVSRESKQGLKEYQSEVKIISQLRHKNLVQLIGWCHKKGGELLLVYEFMPNGSLDSHLFKGKSVLTWELRYKIAKGLASALSYLHEDGTRCVLHRDIKASNIMLDSNFDAKLGDFGLARLVDHKKGSQTTHLAGTWGYIAPECAISHKASRESDVYSFGIVLLEIACGRRPIDDSLPDGQVILVEWVWSLYGQGKLLDAADPKLNAEFNEQEMECLGVVGLWCVHPDSGSRPSIRQAIHVLNFEARLPSLPPLMPVPTYNTPTMGLASSSTTYSSGVSGPGSYILRSNSSDRSKSSASSTSVLLTSW